MANSTVEPISDPDKRKTIKKGYWLIIGLGIALMPANRQRWQLPFNWRQSPAAA